MSWKRNIRSSQRLNNAHGMQQKEKALGDDMKREYPSIPAEKTFAQSVEGAFTLNNLNPYTLMVVSAKFLIIHICQFTCLGYWGW